MGNQPSTGESLAYVNKGRQLVASGTLKPPGLFGGWLG